MASREQAEAFITEFQSILDAGTELVFVPRTENMSAMQYFGFNVKTIKQELLQLTVEHYSDGPLPDRDDRPGHVWIFGYELYDNDMYVKLKIGLKPSSSGGVEKNPICLSWHKTDKPLPRPFR